LQNFIKNNLCKVSRRRARDQDQNPLRPRRDLRPSRPRLQETSLETRLETETKSRDSITGNLTITFSAISITAILMIQSYTITDTICIVH